MLQEASIESKVVPQSSRPTSDKNIVIAAKGGAILFLGELFTYITGFLLSVIIARFLGAEQFGLYRLSLTVTSIAAAACLMGLDGGLARFIPIAVKQRSENRIWGLIQVGVGIPFLISLILTSILILMAEPISIEVFKKPSLIPVFRMLCFIIPLTVLADGLSSVTRGFKKVQYDVYSRSIAFQVTKLLLTISLLSVGMDVLGVAISHNVAITIATLMMLFFVNRIFSLKRPVKNAQRNIREIFHFSLPLYFGRLLYQFSRQLEMLVLGILAVFSDVGIYAAILRLSNIGIMGLNALQKISEPLISELHSQGKEDELRRLYQTTTKWSLTFNLPIFLTVLFFADNLLSIFGENFTGGATGFIILSSGLLFRASTGFCGTVVNMTGHTRLGLFNSIVYVAAAIILDFVLISRWQLIGAAMAGTLTMIIVNTLATTEVFFLNGGLLPFNRSFLKPITAAFLSAGLIFILTQSFSVDSPLLQLAIFTPILWFVYGAIVYLLKLSKEDRLILSELFSRIKKSENSEPTPKL